jgi:hypothetical protein
MHLRTPSLSLPMLSFANRSLHRANYSIIGKRTRHILRPITGSISVNFFLCADVEQLPHVSTSRRRRGLLSSDGTISISKFAGLSEHDIFARLSTEGALLWMDIDDLLEYVIRLNTPQLHDREPLLDSSNNSSCCHGPLLRRSITSEEKFKPLICFGRHSTIIPSRKSYRTLI